MLRYVRPAAYRCWRNLLLALGIVAAWAASGLAGTSLAIPEVVATIQDETISADELLASMESELLRLEMERYEAMKKQLDVLIAQRIVRLEATKRGLSVQEFEKQEILDKVEPVTPEAVKDFYEKNKARIRQPLEQIEPRLTTYLRQQAQRQRQEALFKDLLQNYPVKIALRAPKADVSADDDPFTGPADALVTVIEFSDFQCPYCRRVQPALKKLLQEYAGKVRLVFRDFPLRQSHPQAQKAAEAAQCAAEQDQFWPYHDKLFTDAQMPVATLKKYAEELALDMAAFNTCLDAGKYADEIEKDIQDGQKFGVRATPTFFVNGVLVSGAAPYERFEELVDAALKEVHSAAKTN